MLVACHTQLFQKILGIIISFFSIKARKIHFCLALIFFIIREFFCDLWLRLTYFIVFIWISVCHKKISSDLKLKLKHVISYFYSLRISNFPSHFYKFTILLIGKCQCLINFVVEIGVKNDEVECKVSHHNHIDRSQETFISIYCFPLISLVIDSKTSFQIIENVKEKFTWIIWWILWGLFLPLVMLGMDERNHRISHTLYGY